MKNREIKFRAWVDNFNPNQVVPQMIYQPGITNNNLPILSVFDGHYVDILMQYTGLKDKNGKEIYEGDIITGHFGDEDDYDDPTPEIKMTGIVEYNYDGFILMVIQKMSDENRVGMANWFSFIEETDIFKDIEIIGNIYENPNLIN